MQKNQEIIESLIGPKPKERKSALSTAKIQNYMLILSLMKLIAIRFQNAYRESFDNNVFEIAVGQQLEFLKDIEAAIAAKKAAQPFVRKPQSQKSRSKSPSLTEPDIQISYLVIQHKREVLDRIYDFNAVIKETFSHEFMKMFKETIFTPLMHEETPELENFPF